MTPRIPVVPRSAWNDQVRAALGPLAERDPLDNVFATFVQHPDLFRRYSPLGVHILAKSTLSAREKEMAILRIGSLNRCETSSRSMPKSAGPPDSVIPRLPVSIRGRQMPSGSRSIAPSCRRPTICSCEA